MAEARNGEDVHIFVKLVTDSYGQPTEAASIAFAPDSTDLLVHGFSCFINSPEFTEDMFDDFNTGIAGITVTVSW